MTLTEEKKNKIIELADKGVKIKDICKIIDSSYPTVSKYIEEDGGEIREEENNGHNTTIKRKTGSHNISEQLYFNLNRIAIKTNRTIEELLDKVEFILDEYLKLTNKPMNLFEYTVYWAELLTRKQFSEEEEIIEYFKKLCEKNQELEELEEKIEYIKTIGKENILFLKEEEKKLVEQARILTGYITSLEQIKQIEKHKIMNKNKLLEGFMETQ